jgi:CHAD domain-containing protein
MAARRACCAAYGPAIAPDQLSIRPSGSIPPFRAFDRPQTETELAASFTALVLGLAAWTETGREHRRLLGNKRLERRLSRIVPGLLDRLLRKVEKRGRAIAPDASPAALHPLRKSVKKLRYGVEFVASL